MARYLSGMVQTMTGIGMSSQAYHNLFHDIEK